MNPFYTRQFDVTPGSAVGSDDVEAEFQRIEHGFDGVNVEVGAANAAAADATAAASTAGSSAADATSAAVRAENAAAAAGAAANAQPWVSGQIYAANAVAIDTHPTDLQNYRRRTAGSGTVRPGLDGTNWVRLGGGTNPIDDPFFWMN